MSASSSASRIEPHHEAAARSWGHGGRAYDDISFVLSDALAHAAQRLDAPPVRRSWTSPPAPAGPPATRPAAEPG